jgi:predicted 3-demethylubiquinone-9 3-methyltransferase (glyoxalase superfamily)
MREHPLHEQIGGSLTEDDVTEALTGEVTTETREEVEDLFADVQEEEADRQAK